MNTELLDRYIAAWNERDADKRRAAVDALWAPEGTYTDPLAEVRGREAIDATIAAVQAQFPDFAFRPGALFDAHHDIARFTWELGPVGGEAVVIGFDVAVLDPNGQIQHVHGFLDKIPTT
ncbi:nuclear transport factor 2 family protein [Saccharopolyspora indica]|uniref:nuclear transport factor 2 family protein n=1 Tax=Saccharopolyspora indica TaxID=1229659 RepID=UPI0022EB7A09|nr:nuclear transport factor 2 family protein [Saccharopolyspora indica]MDA3644928.1 nuclear transport factor 2 family protein [Saccharopolyspora indica]